ncbi:hypothetical protein FCM35_KLT11776 [Carex littledalei]|uniref:Uncharacterized protein n=1 Tax=Carex littledalei TaxID=544730 RepID=A0A833QKY6_9POAL|nr:hypothetical protein FCM35_KLT11776 [Carex littledalei]
MERGHGGGVYSRTAAVQSTNDDDATSKLWCVNKGYIKEDHVHFFVRRQIRYATWVALRKMLLQCLNTQTDERKQILSLKAGFDATYFQLLVRGSLFRVER